MRLANPGGYGSRTQVRQVIGDLSPARKGNAVISSATPSDRSPQGQQEPTHLCEEPLSAAVDFAATELPGLRQIVMSPV